MIRMEISIIWKEFGMVREHDFMEKFALSHRDHVDDSQSTEFNVCLSWWRHQMETFSALLAICAGNSSVPGEFPAQRPLTQSFDVFFDLRLNKRLRKQSWGWWFVTLLCPLWCHCNVKLGGRFRIYNCHGLLHYLCSVHALNKSRRGLYSSENFIHEASVMELYGNELDIPFNSAWDIAVSQCMEFADEDPVTVVNGVHLVCWHSTRSVCSLYI